MKNIRTIPLCITLCLCLFFPVASAAMGGGENGRDQQFRKGQELVNSFDLTGSYLYGLYNGEGRSIGTMRMTVSFVKDDGPAVYRVRNQRELDQPGTHMLGRMEGWSEDLLDANMGLIQHASRDSFGMMGTVQWQARRTAQSPARWTASVEKDTFRDEFTIVAPDGNYWSKPCLWMLARRMDVSRPARYLLKGIVWPQTFIPEEADGVPDYADISIEISDEVPFAYRGSIELVHLVRMAVEGAMTTVAAVTGDHRVVHMYIEERPGIRFILGDEVTVRRDLDPVETDRTDVLEAAARWFYAMAGLASIDTLDDIVDWEAVQSEMNEEKPAFVDTPVDQFAGIMKDEYCRARLQLQREEINALALELDAAVDGDSASVGLAARPEDRFELHRTPEGKWLITHFPQ